MSQQNASVLAASTERGPSSLICKFLKTGTTSLSSLIPSPLYRYSKYLLTLENRRISANVETKKEWMSTYNQSQLFVWISHLPLNINGNVLKRLQSQCWKSPDHQFSNLILQRLKFTKETEGRYGCQEKQSPPCVPTSLEQIFSAPYIQVPNNSVFARGESCCCQKEGENYCFQPRGHHWMSRRLSEKAPIKRKCHGNKTCWFESGLGASSETNCVSLGKFVPQSPHL